MPKNEGVNRFLSAGSEPINNGEPGEPGRHSNHPTAHPKQETGSDEHYCLHINQNVGGTDDEA